MSRDRHRQTLQALRIARESRDGYPSQFAGELRTLVDALCEQLRVDEPTHIEALKVAGLQDLGLLGVNHTTLAADRTLNPDERAEINKAPLVAQSLVAAMPGYESVAKEVRHAHERWDGKGYPDGLSGTDIPLVSRIVAVAGAYQAMCSPRPYRAAMHPKVVLDELSHGAGSQFDPQIVEALLTLVRPMLAED